MADPHTRAWYDPSLERKKQCHENILRHPFFWNDRQATNFLVALGNLRSYDFPDELARIDAIIHELLDGYLRLSCSLVCATCAVVCVVVSDYAR
jgi:hypothetical protein